MIAVMPSASVQVSIGSSRSLVPTDPVRVQIGSTRFVFSPLYPLTLIDYPLNCGTVGQIWPVTG